MSRAAEEQNRRLLRARDAMDRSYAQPLDVSSLVRIAHVSEAHFIRTFRVTFGETPHRYLQRRRVERAMSLLRETECSVTEICLDVGFGSLGTFTRTFRAVVGASPTTYRNRGQADAVPTCARARGVHQVLTANSRGHSTSVPSRLPGLVIGPPVPSPVPARRSGALICPDPTFGLALTLLE
ncbi:MAG: AraC family transcriptional regulator [Actinomycetota bacterium]|nr:AraC family transcriptional regulator [Actinomycetota bacterium]